MHKERGGGQKEPVFYPRKRRNGICSSGAGGYDTEDVVAAVYGVITPTRSYCLQKWEAQKGICIPPGGSRLLPGA